MTFSTHFIVIYSYSLQQSRKWRICSLCNMYNQKITTVHEIHNRSVKLSSPFHQEASKQMATKSVRSVVTHFRLLPYVEGYSEKFSNIFNWNNDYRYPLCSGLVYKRNCHNCDDVYVGQTKSFLKTRTANHNSDIRLGKTEKWEFELILRTLKF